MVEREAFNFDSRYGLCATPLEQNHITFKHHYFFPILNDITIVRKIYKFYIIIYTFIIVLLNKKNL